jgi:hypothetical protein
MRIYLLPLLLLLNSCSYIGINWSDEDEPEREVIADTPKQNNFFSKRDDGISIYDQHHRYTFFMKIDRTVIFENAHRGQNEIAGQKDNSKLGDSCKMQRVVGAYTRDILVVDNKPRMFRLMRSVTEGKKVASPILIAVDVKSGNTTFEIHCPDISQYNTSLLEENFGFQVIPEKKKLKDNFI